MNKILITLLVVAMAIALVVVAGCEGGEALVSEDAIVVNAGTQQTGIWVSGEGKVYAEPDLAILNLGVEAQASTISEARDQAAEAMNNVMAELQAAGIDEKDIQTTRFNIYPVNKWDRDTEEEILVGYRVSNMVTVKIRDIEKIGGIIDSVTDAGGDLTRIQNISFTVEDPTPYQEEARAKAFAKAKAKAEQMASLSGETLGKTTYITESQSYYYPVPMRAAEYDIVGGGQTPISPGEQEISVNVQIAFKIK